jgi:hypothetical protein
MGFWLAHLKMSATEQGVEIKFCGLLDKYEHFKKCMVLLQWGKPRFSGGINIFVMAVRASMTIRAKSNRQL